MNKRRLAKGNATFSISLSILFALLTYSVAGFAEGTDPVDQVSLNLNVQQVGSTDISALIINEQAYLPVKELFDYLKIKNVQSNDFNTVRGSLIDPKAAFEIDVLNWRIVFLGKIFTLKTSDIIRTEGELYLRAELYGQIFGLNCLFRFRSLSVTLTTNLQLPAIRDLKLAQMRKNISALKGEQKADTTLNNQYPLFALGVADWSVSSSQDNTGNTNTRANFVLGAVVGGGQATANITYNSNRPFDQKDQYYQWRFVNNEQPFIKQITAGRIFPLSISSIYSPVNGVQISNTPTTYRRSFGTYRINNTTEPGWLVELYVNDILVNYTTADASGFYSFDVPIVYGNSAIRTRFYGPWGEERTQEQYVNIPFNFLPVGQVEYTLAAGVVDNLAKDILMRTSMSYGLNNYMTIGAGTEFLSGVNAEIPMAFVNSSIRLTPGLLVSGQYTPGVNVKGTLNYQLPADLQLNVNYTKYDREQTAILFNYLEERKVELSIPIRTKNFNAYSRFSFNQFVLPKSTITNAQFMTSAVISGVGTNFSTSLLYTDLGKPYMYSNLSLTFRLPRNLRFSPHIQYEYKQKYISSIKAELEKRIGNFGFATLGYEKNIPIKISTLSLGLRLNLSFAQTYASVTQGNRSTMFTQSASGSLLYNSNQHSLSSTSQSNVGKGGLSISAFLDLNRNGRRDPVEPRAPGLKLKISGGRTKKNDRDTSINVSGLEAYAKYFIQIDPNSFENISWRLNNKLIEVTVEANRYRSIEIPITVAAEASGYVNMIKPAGQSALSGIIVEIYNSKSVFICKTLTESDGYFTFMDLAPGKYTARLNEAQLKVLQLKPGQVLPFEVKLNKDGDIIDGLDFSLQSRLLIKKQE